MCQGPGGDCPLAARGRAAWVGTNVSHLVVAESMYREWKLDAKQQKRQKSYGHDWHWIGNTYQASTACQTPGRSAGDRAPREPSACAHSRTAREGDGQLHGPLSQPAARCTALRGLTKGHPHGGVQGESCWEEMTSWLRQKAENRSAR